MDAIVLTSGGLDSAVLLAHQAALAGVHPVYVRAGLAWEEAELRMLRHLLAAPAFAASAPLQILDVDMRDVYPATHWALHGTPPAYDTPDEDVYLPGRNLVLLGKTAVLAAARGISRIALGPLAGNPFPDASPAFFDTMARALSLGLDHRLEIATPFAALHKDDVIRLGASLGVPLDRTLSCMNPDTLAVPRHCGQCSKCRERRDAFAAARVDDPASYAQSSPR